MGSEINLICIYEFRLEQCNDFIQLLLIEKRLLENSSNCHFSFEKFIPNTIPILDVYATVSVIIYTLYIFQISNKSLHIFVKV